MSLDRTEKRVARAILRRIDDIEAHAAEVRSDVAALLADDATQPDVGHGEPSHADREHHLMYNNDTPPDPAREPEVVDEPGVGAVVRDRDGICWTRQGKVWWTPDDKWARDCSWQPLLTRGPLTLVTPATPTPTGGDGEAVEAWLWTDDEGTKRVTLDAPANQREPWTRRVWSVVPLVRASLTGPAR